MKVQELCDRYQLGSRKSLYSRLNSLNIKLDKDSNNKSYATEEQIEELDRLDEHLKSGGNLKNYVPVTQVTVHNKATQHSTQLKETKELATIVETTQLGEQLTVTPQLLEMVTAIAEGLASKLTPREPLWDLVALEKASASDWELTTSQVQDIIGTKPRCLKGEKTYKRGSFIFVKSGKIGNQTSWKVMKEVKNDGDNLSNNY